MTTIYDQYQRMLEEQRKQTGLMYAQTAISATQTAISATMAGSLNNIQAEMDAVRRQNLEGLAIQQEMMRREQLQGQLEEFVYNAEKIVAFYSATECDEPLSSRYFTLKGILDTVQQNSICTAIIRGRENKAAFDQALADVNRLAAALEAEPEVKEALAWIKAEEERVAKKRSEDQQRAEANRRREAQRQQILAKIRQLEASKSFAFGAWYKRTFYLPLTGFLGQTLAVPPQVLLWCLYGFLWIPALWLACSYFNKAKQVEVVDKQIAQLQEELRRLEG